MTSHLATTFWTIDFSSVRPQLVSERHHLPLPERYQLPLRLRQDPPFNLMVADCLRKAFNISVAKTSDTQGRERYHTFPPHWHYHWRPGNNSDWFYNQTKGFGMKTGTDCCAPYSVSFHYIRKPAMVRHLFSLLYDSNCQRDHRDALDKAMDGGDVNMTNKR